MIVDRHGTPLAVSLTGGNRHDVTQLIPLLDAIPRLRGRRGRPRHKPKRPSPSTVSNQRSTPAAEYATPQHAGLPVPKPASFPHGQPRSSTSTPPLSEAADTRPAAGGATLSLAANSRIFRAPLPYPSGINVTGG